MRAAGRLTGAVRGFGDRFEAATELPAVRQDEEKVALLGQAVAENRRQDVLLADVVSHLEQQLVAALERAVEVPR